MPYNQANLAGNSTSNGTLPESDAPVFSSHSYIYQLTCANHSITCDSLLGNLQNNTDINATVLDEGNCSQPISQVFESNCTNALVPVELATCGNTTDIRSAVLITSALNFLCEFSTANECSNESGFSSEDFALGFLTGIGSFAAAALLLILLAYCVGGKKALENAFRDVHMDVESINEENLRQAVMLSTLETRKTRRLEEKTEEKNSEVDEYESGHTSGLGLSLRS